MKCEIQYVGISMVDGGQDPMVDWELMAWNESSLHDLIMLTLDLYTDACDVL